MRRFSEFETADECGWMRIFPAENAMKIKNQKYNIKIEVSPWAKFFDMGTWIQDKWRARPTKVKDIR